MRKRDARWPIPPRENGSPLRRPNMTNETRVSHMMAKIRVGLRDPPKSGTLLFIN